MCGLSIDLCNIRYVVTHLLQEKKREFITFHDNKPLEPLVTAKWEDFNVMANATIADILQWVSLLAMLGEFIYKQSLKEELSEMTTNSQNNIFINQCC